MSNHGNTCYLIMENDTLRHAGTDLAVSTPDSSYAPRHKFSVNEDECVTQNGSRRGGQIPSTSRTQIPVLSMAKTPVDQEGAVGTEKAASIITKDS